MNEAEQFAKWVATGVATKYATSVMSILKNMLKASQRKKVRNNDSFRLSYMLCIKTYTNATKVRKETDLVISL